MVTVSKELQQTLQTAVARGPPTRHEYVTLEHLLHAMTRDKIAAEVLAACGADLRLLEQELEEYLDRTLESRPSACQEPEQTAAFQRVLQRAAWHVQGAGRTELNAGDVLVAITRERGSHAVYLLEKQGVRRLDILQYISHGIGKEGRRRRGAGEPGRARARRRPAAGEGPVPGLHRQPGRARRPGARSTRSSAASAELERTIQVLCRRRKNNPVFVGDPGVGKTAIVEGLALAHPREEGPGGAGEGGHLPRSTWARCWPGPSSAASSSSGSRA